MDKLNVAVADDNERILEDVYKRQDIVCSQVFVFRSSYAGFQYPSA